MASDAGSLELKGLPDPVAVCEVRWEPPGDTVPPLPLPPLLVGAGRAQGVEPADIIRTIVDNSHLEGEDVTGVRVLERFSFVEVPAERAGDVVRDVAGKRLRGKELRLEVTTR